MRCFVDTSALYALVSGTDHHHAEAAGFLARCAPEDELLTHNYVVVETTALVQHRLGLEVTRRLHTDLLPRLAVVWVTPEVHEAAVATLLADGGRGLSLVDRVSFEVMRRSELTGAFAFDEDFREAGFRALP